MLSIIGTVLKKEKKSNYKKAELVVQDSFNNKHLIQVRRGNLDKIIEVDTGQRIKAFYRVDMSEKYNSERNETTRFSNNILIDIEILN